MRAETTTLDPWEFTGEIDPAFLQVPDDDNHDHHTLKAEKRSSSPSKRASATRFGPLPGEVYPDEAHFGSFS